ncbi:protein CIP2A homolog isoform X2 [Bolinopsis microptera]|uniref:protein CIP2A homolog isoform X2 n=1 Tax=Bolinopsis microptera TaxID=2820187 RepID=UPI003078AB0A
MIAKSRVARSRVARSRVVIVHSLSLITALCLNEDLGNKLFVGNVDGTYTLVMNMLNSGDQDTKLYCLNLLIDFTKSETMLSAFVNCQQNLLADLTQNDLLDGVPCIRDKVCELLLHLTTKDSDLYTRIMKLFTDDITRCLIDQLGNEGNSTALLGLLHVLLPDLCENSQDNRDILVRKLTSNLENIPLHWRSKQGYNTVTLSCQCLRVMHQDTLSQSAISSSLLSLPESVCSWLESAPNPYDKESGPLYGTDSCRALLEMLSLCVEIGLHDYHTVLTQPNLPSFIGKAMLSDDSSLIIMALKINAICFEKSGTFAPMVGNIMAHHCTMVSCGSDTATQELLELKRKYLELQKSSCQLEEDRCPSPPIPLNSQVSELINQMRDGLHIKDIRSSQLIEIFQEKMAIMATKEDQLNDLVEAKTMALQQSDRLFTQFRQRVAQAERECEKYRAMLQESELEGDSRREEMCKLLNEKNELLSEVEILRVELTESTKYQEKYAITCDQLNVLKDKYTVAASLNSDLTDKLEGLKEEVDILRVHNETLKSQHESDVTQVQVLQKEKQKVVTKLEEKDNLYLKTKQSLRQSEEKNRKKDKEKIDLDSQLSKAKSEFSKIDSKYKELVEKEKMQGCKVVEKEKAIEALNSEVTKQKEEIEKYSKLMAMFHNLSTTKIVK